MPYPLTNFEIERLYLNEPRFNCVFSRNYSPENPKLGICNKSQGL